MKIFNPKSGNEVDIDWAVSQEIIDESGQYLAEDGSPTTILEVVDPDVDMSEDELQQKAEKTKEVAHEHFGQDFAFETSKGDEVGSAEEARQLVEDLYAENDELTTKSNFLYEEKGRLEGQVEKLEQKLESESGKVDRLRDQLQDAEDTILELRSELRESEQELSDAEDQIDELSDAETTYENTDIGGIRVND